MNKLLISFLSLTLLAGCAAEPEVSAQLDPVAEPIDDGKGPSEAVLLITEDGNGGSSYELTTYDEEDTESYLRLHLLNVESVFNDDGSMAHTLSYNGEVVETLQSGGESVLKVAHAGQFEEGGGQPYLYLELAPSGLGGYILYEVPGVFYRLNLETLELETMPAPVYDFFGGETSEGELVFWGVGMEGYEGMDGNEFTISVTDLADLTLREFSYASDEYGVIGHPSFSPNGDKIAFTASRNNPDDEQSAVLVLDLSTGEIEEVASGAEWYDITGWSADGTPVIR